MPCGLCERWIEEEPLIQLYWDGGGVEGRRLSGDRLFVLAMEYTSNGFAAARDLEDFVAALWCVERYRVHADGWLPFKFDWRPAVVRIRAEWLRWCICEDGGVGRLVWVAALGRQIRGVGPIMGGHYRFRAASHLPKCITYANARPWYFICEACQRERRQEDAGWSYENINVDGGASTASSTDWSN